MSTELEHLDVRHNSGTNAYYIDSDGVHMPAYEWLNHDFVPINPSSMTFQYDIVCSIAKGNQFYIGWERYDENKTARSNNATVYVVATKPTADITKQRYQGTVNLSTDGVNPAAFCRLRILNAWTGTDSTSTKLATIHSLSLRVVTAGEVPTREIKANGQIIGDHFRESFNGLASINQNGFIDGTDLYEY